MMSTVRWKRPIKRAKKVLMSSVQTPGREKKRGLPKCHLKKRTERLGGIAEGGAGLRELQGASSRKRNRSRLDTERSLRSDVTKRD